ncbi:MAG: Stp1/IreP family PP2C-type Ser/Thr phosphatase [Candidatus Fermentithermobacillus carboniphilus]|uniref:Stp1/IreP family PP2C-type Ser/Thr phosphatase n=1 Tax=Candidatus Fermentithermobacillus carboniphilus TaxID=3085328 RepID=A0AAT9LDX7_9FIRM|nr:MAG: Stp1/IreP family PP2C-type Ser/Thr phosphatase [Candidatus Fermentithermobacillus carboniphilus]
MQWRAKTSRGLVRPENEDSWAVVDLSSSGRNIWLAMVADGLGGHEGGEVASSLAVKSAVDYISLHIPQDPPPKLLQDAVEYGNRKVLQAATSGTGFPGMGTTLTCALVEEETSRLYVGHVGDSRVYLISGSKIRQITDDHSVTGELVRNGTISEEDAMRHPARNVLTMALGTQARVEVATYEEELSPGDVILLCTDGLTSLVSPSEIADVISKRRQDDVADALVDLANSRGGYDNVTVVVLWPAISPVPSPKRGETS